MTQGIRSLLHQAGAPRMLWAEAAKHFCSILNRTPRPAPDGKLVIPLLAEKQSVDSTTERLHEDDDPSRWPPWGCRVVALMPRIDRDTKLDAVAVMGLFLGYDFTVTGGVRVALLKLVQNTFEVDRVVVTTTVRKKDEEFPLAAAKRPADDELRTSEMELRSESQEGTRPLASDSPSAVETETELDSEMEAIFAPKARGRGRGGRGRG